MAMSRSVYASIGDTHVGYIHVRSVQLLIILVAFSMMGKGTGKWAIFLLL